MRSALRASHRQLGSEDSRAPAYRSPLARLDERERLLRPSHGHLHSNDTQSAIAVYQEPAALGLN
jgi:hypothetical protein